MHDHSSMMNPHHNHDESETRPKEYIKFLGVILGITLASYILSQTLGQQTWPEFLRIFMAVFFLVFGLFKLLDLRGFVESYIGYDVIAKRFIAYAWIYPFLELALAFGYFLRIPYTEWATLIIMTIGSIGVIKELLRGSKIKCACLGTYIKLPLTTVSLVEDLAMGIMALLMIIKII